MDDGSKSTEMTAKMLETETEHGVTRIVATPHFYPTKEAPDSFLERRKRSYAHLKSKYPDIPEIILGAEVLFYDGLSRSDRLDDFRIGNTNAILIEMPFSKWPSSVIDEIFDIADSGYTPILAHIERYLNHHNKKILEELLTGSVMIQSNAEFFIDKKTRKTAFKMLERDMIHLLGTDCHNLTTRPPNIGECLALADPHAFDRIEANARRLLG